MLYSRRDFGKVVLATGAVSGAASRLFAAAKPKSKFGGVQIGAITYSFRALPGSAEETLKSEQQIREPRYGLTRFWVGNKMATMSANILNLFGNPGLLTLGSRLYLCLHQIAIQDLGELFELLDRR